MDPFRRELTDQSIEKVLEVIELFRRLDPEIPGQVIACFLYIASHNDCHKQALEEDLYLAVASSSRSTDYLKKTNRLGQKGLDLIKKEVDPTNKRRVTLSLTSKGERLANDIKKILYD